jgi:phage terminase large subunit-like protein
VCYEQHDFSVKVLERVIDDDAHFAFIAAIDDPDDWLDEAAWLQANPNLGVSVKLDDLRRKADRAREMPTSQNAFLRLHLGVWTEAAVRWLPAERWGACASKFDPKLLRGRECWAGLDLAGTQDLSALVLVFPAKDGDEDEEAVMVLPFFWAPRENAARRERSDRAPYLTWGNQGHMELTDGEVTDYNFILKRLDELSEVYAIREVAFDRFGAASVVTALQDRGFTVVQFGQGYVSMSTPAKDRAAGRVQADRPPGQPGDELVRGQRGGRAGRGGEHQAEPQEEYGEDRRGRRDDDGGGADDGAGRGGERLRRVGGTAGAAAGAVR